MHQPHPISFTKFRQRLIDKKLVDAKTGEIKGKQEEIDDEWESFLSEPDEYHYNSEDS